MFLEIFIYKLTYYYSMSIYSRALAKLSAISDKKDSNLPWSKAAEDSSEIAFSDTTYFQKPSGKKELEILYRNCWAIFKAINVRANLLASRGLKIVCKSDKAQEVINIMLKRMHPTRPMLALQNSFRNRSINADIWGWAPDELLYDPKGTLENPGDPENAKALNGFRPIHPVNLDFQRNEEGKILFENGVPKGWDYKQDPSNDLKSIELPFKRIAFLKYNQIGDEILGMSTIEPIFKTGERLMKIEEGITQGILTHGNPLHDVIVGDEAHPPTKKMIDNTADEVKGLNLKSEYVHPPWIRVGQIEAFSLGKSPNYMQPFITAIAAATQVPEFILLGRGEGTNKATAQAMINFIHQTIEPLQQAQALYFEEEILAPLMKLNGISEIPMIEWNEILPHTPAELADAIKTMSETILEEKVIVTYEEARELLNLGKDLSFKKPSGSELAEKESMDGIYFKAPVPEMIAKGETKLIVLSEKFDEIQTPIYLISENQVFGIIKLREHEEINLEKFDDLKTEHKLSESYKEENFSHKEKLFAYKFNVLEMFKEPKDYELPQGAQTFVKDVKI